MAVVTTVATTPILDRLNRGNALLDRDEPEAQVRPGDRRASAHRVEAQ
jgi:hypothetical protein